jgi:hypothetical protein
MPASPVPATNDLVASLPGSVTVVFPITHRSSYAGYCNLRRFGSVRKTLAAAVLDATSDESSYLSDVEEQATGVDPYGSTRIPTSFLVSTRRATAPESPSITGFALVVGGPDNGQYLYTNWAEADALAARMALDHYGWRVAGADDLYPGTVSYPIDAHDDTLLFEYSASGGASLRVCPVPHGSTQPAEAMHASEFNCERETLHYYAQRPYVRAVGDQMWRYVGRPVYADGTVGPVCVEGADDLLSSCDDLCGEDSSGG